MKKRLPLLYILILAVGLAACAESRPNEGSLTEDGEAAETEELRIFFDSKLLFVNRNDNIVIREIERLTGTRLFCEETVRGYEKLSVLIAGNQMPDIINADAAVLARFGNEGALLNFNDCIEDMPAARAALSREILVKSENSTGLYALRPVSEQDPPALYVRRDWMEKLGLSQPEALGEFMDMLIAMRDGDPDGNGLPDTVPMAFNDINLVTAAFGLPQGEFIAGASGIIYTNTAPEMREAWSFARRLYEERLIPPNFAAMDSAQVYKLFTDGTCGMLYSRIGDSMEISAALRKKDENASMIALAPPAAENAAAIPVWSLQTYIDGSEKAMDTKGTAAAAGTANRDEVLRLLDWFYTAEAETALNMGVENVSYIMEEGGAEFTQDMRGSENIHNRRISGIGGAYFLAGVHSSAYPSGSRFLEMADLRSVEIAAEYTGDRLISFTTPTGELIQPEAEKLFREYMLKAVMGETGVDTAFDSWCAEFERIGGSAWLDEVNTGYRKLMQSRK